MEGEPTKDDLMTVLPQDLEDEDEEADGEEAEE